MVDKNEITYKILEKYFTAFDFPSEEISIFLTLVQHGDLTILELSRKVSIPRSTVYRVVESLKKRGLAVDRIEEYSHKISVVGIEKIELLIKQKQEEANYLQSMFGTVKTYFLKKDMLAQPETKVYFYRGKKGIEQMVWNVLQAKTEILGYSYLYMNDFMGDVFMSRFREEFLQRKRNGRDIYSDSYLKSRSGYLKKSKKTKVLEPGWISRYLSQDILDIDHQLDIYDDIVGIYNWHDGEVFGVEIHNKKVARLQRQIFEIVWQKATPEIV